MMNAEALAELFRRRVKPRIPGRMRGMLATLGGEMFELRRQAEIAWSAQVFRNYRRRRNRLFGKHLGGLRCPGEPGLVSIVLPVYNGANFVEEALESVRAQTYRRFELIAINDGSTDATPHILEMWARRDERIRVLHQENRKIPATLSRGFRLARGEFLTWTSADNRLKPQFLAKLVGCLHRHPDWDMAYANQSLIDERGAPLCGSDKYRRFQRPSGSQYIHLPTRTAALHSIADNYVGAAFLYRSRVAYLLGDYSPCRFTVEDYDYWLLVDALLSLRHTDFADPIYEYRFHRGALSARSRELRIQEARDRLLAFDRRRLSLFLAPIGWRIEADAHGQAAARMLATLTQAAGQLVFYGSHSTADSQSRAAAEPSGWPAGMLPMIYVRLQTTAAPIAALPELPPGTLRALVFLGTEPAARPGLDWDVVVGLGTGEAPKLQSEGYQGLWRADSLATLALALDIRCRAACVRRLEATTELKR